MQPPKEILSKFNEVCPDLVWDRFTESSFQFTCFGWIKRRDGNRDFLTIIFQPWELIDDVQFITSSAKYSKIFAEVIGCVEDHVDCQKIEL